MGRILNEFSEISDVSYLLTRLRMAKRKNETQVIEGIIGRLNEMGVLKEAEAGVDIPFRNLRTLVAVILGKQEFHLPEKMFEAKG